MEYDTDTDTEVLCKKLTETYRTLNCQYHNTVTSIVIANFDSEYFGNTER